MHKFAIFAAVVSASAGLSACKSTDDSLADARFSEVSPQNVQTVQEAIAPFFNGAIIPLANDVLTRSSEFIVDKRRVLGPQGQVINGRDVTDLTDPTAERFYLKMKGEQCGILHERSDTFVPLFNVNCISE